MSQSIEKCKQMQVLGIFWPNLKFFFNLKINGHHAWTIHYFLNRWIRWWVTNKCHQESKTRVFQQKIAILVILWLLFNKLKYSYCAALNSLLIYKEEKVKRLIGDQEMSQSVKTWPKIQLVFLYFGQIISFLEI